MKYIVHLLFIFLIAASACKEKGPAEKALGNFGKKVDETSEDLKDDAKDADKEANKQAKKGKKSLKGIKFKLN